MSPRVDPDVAVANASIQGALPGIERPLCEPVELAPGARVRVERVGDGPDVGASGMFPHFHDVHELVLFGQVAGDMFAGDTRWRLAAGCVVSIPSTQAHDFVLEAGARDWVLLQVDADSAATLLRREGLSPLSVATCAMPDAAQRERLDVLLDWLLRLPPDDPQALALVELVLHHVVRAMAVEGEPAPLPADALDRLRPAIERLRRDPAQAPTAEAAAALCALSPAYFSRCFKRRIGLSWSEYVRTHRLQLASQRLLDGSRSAAAIAEELGFSSPSHFGELFLQRFGMTPMAYRNRAREAGRLR